MLLSPYNKPLTDLAPIVFLPCLLLVEWGNARPFHLRPTRGHSLSCFMHPCVLRMSVLRSGCRGNGGESVDFLAFVC